jgi:Ca-activated chloride channel family protein
MKAHAVAVRSTRLLSRSALAALMVTGLVACGAGSQGRAPTNSRAPGQSETQAPPASTVPTVLILDASGSMTQADAPGLRIAAAKAAAHSLIDSLPRHWQQCFFVRH